MKPGDGLPKLGQLVNWAIALDCGIDELIEDAWLGFHEPEDFYHELPYLTDPRGRLARLCAHVPGA